MVTRIPAATLARYLAGLYRAAGLAGRDAAAVAVDQVEADLRGITGHGSRLAPRYLSKLRTGRLNPRPRLAVLADRAGCLALDADLAPGAVAARAAVRAAAARAREFGIGLVTVRGAGHAGALGVYAARLARRGLVGLIAAQTSAASVALHGTGACPVLGNSAVAIAVPGPSADTPVLLDMAAAAMSWGRVQQADRDQASLPPGCAVDQHGQLTTDPHEAVALVPGGGLRGQALAIMTTLLVGPLTGSGALPDGQDGRGLLSLAIDPSHFGVVDDLATGTHRIGHVVRRVGARMPGDRAWAHRATSAARGIALSDQDVCVLLSVADPAVTAVPPELIGHLDLCPSHGEGVSTYDHDRV